MTHLNWPTYDGYKDSGVEWIGDVPAHWDVEPGRRCVVENKEKNTGMKEGTVLSLSYGRVIVKGEDDLTGLVPESFETYQVVRPGDIIIRGTDLQNDKTSLRIGLARDKGIITSAYINLRPKREIDPAFLHYLLHSYDVKKVFYALGSGLRQNLSYDDFKYLRLPIPSTEEQHAITAFLDEKCAKVDEAVRIKEEQIALLRERRQILIQQAVTRGLNPDAPMKDSGIGMDQEDSIKLDSKEAKNLCRFSGGSTPSKERVDYWEDGTVPWVSPKDMKQSYIAETQDRMTEKAVRESTVSFVHPGSLLIVVRSGILQRTIPVAINSVPVTLNQDMKALTFGTALLAKYMMFLIEGNSGALLPILTKEGATVESIEQSNLANCHVPAPPSSEQKAIVAHLEKSNQKLDGAIKIKEKQIAALKEYKTTLINAAVTGKIKVA